jgi:PII-like signaling protein
MSRRFGQQSLEVLSIRKAVAYSKRKVPEKKSSHDTRVVCLLTQLPYAIRTVNDDGKVYDLVEMAHRIYNEQLIFTGRLPLQLLVHRVIQLYIPTYASYSGKLLDTCTNYDRYTDVWQRMASELISNKPPEDAA